MLKYIALVGATWARVPHSRAECADTDLEYACVKVCINEVWIFFCILLPILLYWNLVYNV